MEVLVTLILGMVILAGALIPITANKTPAVRTPGSKVVVNSNNSKDSLQLDTFGIKFEQTASPVECGYPYTSDNPKTSIINKAKKDVNKDVNMVNQFIAPTAQDLTLKVWYVDEHAIDLGLREINGQSFPITKMQNHPSDHALNVNVGPLDIVGGNSAADKEGRPVYPAAFVTNITNNPNSKIGDWEWGGKPFPPSEVHGTWKFSSRKGDQIVMDDNPPQNGANIGDPHNPPGPVVTLDQKDFQSEIVWDITKMGLTSGNTYRIQFLLHDGDLTNTDGGDEDEGCVTVTL